jgi:hypothetical protein
MQKQKFVFARSMALALLAATTLCAQWSQQEFNRAIEGVERETVTGKPYSATAVTTTTQILADGTKISRSMQALLARDSEGRTRREQSMNLVFTTAGPQTVNVAKNMVSIKDPVAGVRYILQPDGQSAVKVSSSGAMGKLDELKRVQVELKMKQAAEGKASGSEAELQDRQKLAELKLRAEKMAQEGATIGVAIIAEGDRKAQVDDLGVSVIEGVHAKGRRETQTIPVGQIGNDRAIQIVSEVWYSDDLQTIVLSKHSDPRVGDSEYRLTNISRAEPARSLFELPAGYTLKEEGRRE